MLRSGNVITATHKPGGSNHATHHTSNGATFSGPAHWNSHEPEWHENDNSHSQPQLNECKGAGEDPIMSSIYGA